MGNTESMDRGCFTVRDIYHYLYHAKLAGMDLALVLEMLEYGDIPPKIRQSVANQSQPSINA